MVNINYLLDSQECLLIKSIAELDLFDYTKHEDYFRENVFKKLFKQLDQTDRDSIFLKNKYLYYLNGGTLAYLEASLSMKGSTIENEVDLVCQVIKSLITNHEFENTQFEYVSLGCGNGEKDYRIISNIMSGQRNFHPTYIPIDISPTLIQLSINHFKKQKNYKGNVFAYNCDFFDFSESLKIGQIDDFVKIYSCLGSTIGNYKEKALFEKFSKIMTDDDFLIASFDLYEENGKINELTKKYNTHANIEFLIHPLKLIPRYKGFLENRSKYFDFNLGAEFKPNRRVTDIANSISFAPTFKIPIEDISVCTAWSTKYHINEVKDFINANTNFKIVTEKTDDSDFLILALKKKPEIEVCRKYIITLIKAIKNDDTVSAKMKQKADKLLEFTNECSDLRKIKAVISRLGGENIKTVRNISSGKMDSAIKEINV